MKVDRKEQVYADYISLIVNGKELGKKALSAIRAELGRIHG